MVVGGVMIVAILGGGTYWWLHKQRYVSTENAFIQADKVSVAPQVDGYVAAVLVDDNQRVSAGQVVVRLDDADLRARLAQAEANAQALQAAVRGIDDKAALEQALIAQKAAGVDSAKAQAQMAQAEAGRYGSLAQQGWVSQQRIQTEQAGARTAQASVAEAEAWLHTFLEPGPGAS
jgi:membrane fusion protein (multidrug efflux system)